jgi:hypothetical protein
MTETNPEPSSAWLGELTAPTASLLLAVLDGDEARASALMSARTRAEIAQIAVNIAEGLIACIHPEDRSGFRESLTGLLQGLAELGTPEPGGG